MGPRAVLHMSPGPGLPGPPPARHRGGADVHICACACACRRVCARVSQDAPPQGELGRATSRCPPRLTTGSLLGFPRHAPRSVGSLFVLDRDKWWAFYTGSLNEGPGDPSGCRGRGPGPGGGGESLSWSSGGRAPTRKAVLSFSAVRGFLGLHARRIDFTSEMSPFGPAEV